MFKKHYNISPFDTKKSAIRKMKDYRRGYFIYKKDDKLYLIAKLKNELNQKKIIFNKSFYKIICFLFSGFKNLNIDLSLSQFVFQNLSTRKIPLNMLMNTFNKKKILQPICFEYFEILKKNNYTISKISYILLWPLYCFLYWGHGNIIFITIIFKSCLNYFKKKKDIDLYFFDISNDNLPIEKSFNHKRESYNLITWFTNYYEKENKDKIINIGHNNNKLGRKIIRDKEISFSNEPWLCMDSFFSLLIFCIIGFFLSILSFIFLLFNKWSPALMLGEILKACSTSLANKKKYQKNICSLIPIHVIAHYGLISLKINL